MDLPIASLNFILDFCFVSFQIFTLLIAKARAKWHQIEVSKFFFLGFMEVLQKGERQEGGGGGPLLSVFSLNHAKFKKDVQNKGA